MAAKVTASKTAAAPEAPPSPLDPGSGSTFEVLRLTTSDKAAEDRVPLFYIDDVEYTIPKRPRMNIALQFMHLAREQSDGAATDYLLSKLLGDDGYQALREYDDLTPEHFQRITEIASRVTLGSLELPKE